MELSEIPTSELNAELGRRHNQRLITVIPFIEAGELHQDMTLREAVTMLEKRRVLQDRDFREYNGVKFSMGWMNIYNCGGIKIWSLHMEYNGEHYDKDKAECQYATNITIGAMAEGVRDD